MSLVLNTVHFNIFLNCVIYSLSGYFIQELFVRVNLFLIWFTHSCLKMEIHKFQNFAIWLMALVAVHFMISLLYFDSSVSVILSLNQYVYLFVFGLVVAGVSRCGPSETSSIYDSCLAFSNSCLLTATADSTWADLFPKHPRVHIQTIRAIAMLFSRISRLWLG